MVQVIQPETNASRAWQGFGQALNSSLSEQLPKEVERIRLSQGLDNLGKNMQPGQTPFSQFSQLLSIPGMTPERAQAIYPFLQAQAAKMEQSGASQSGKPQNISPGAPTAVKQADAESIQSKSIGAPQSDNLPVDVDTFSLVTPELTEMGQRVYEPPSQEDKRRMAAELSIEKPASFPTIEAAENEINKREAAKEAQISSDRKKYERARELQDTVDNSFMTSLKNLETSVPGEIEQKLKAKAYREVASGKKSASEAGTQYGKAALQLSKDLDKLQAAGASSWLNMDPEDQENQINSLSKSFKKDGLGNLFADKVIADFGLSPGMAYSLTYPVKDDKQINNYISGLKQTGTPGLFSNTPMSKKTGAKVSKITDDLSQLITEDTSLLSTSLALDQRGYSGKQFLDEIQDRFENHQLALYEHQIEELKRPHANKETLNDWWFYGARGPKPTTYRK